MNTEYTARICRQHHALYGALIDGEELTATPSGRMKKSGELPVVGDYVSLRQEGGSAVITDIAPRRSLIQRKAAGTSEAPQAIAANVDVAFICMALDQNYNLRRLERYIAALGGSGARLTVLLTKADLCPEAPARQSEIRAAYPDTAVLLCSNADGRGYSEAAAMLGPGVTAVFAGSSGVGKSTLINALTGGGLKTGAVRQEDGRGRHTTTHRQLIPLPNGGAVIDTPGMRELALYDGDVGGAFPEIEALARDCRFGDCTHTREPGCAVLAALDDGRLDEKRYWSYIKLGVEKRERIKKRMTFKR